MKDYRLVYIVKGSKDEKEAIAARASVEKVLLEKGAKITEKEELGKRSLAYKIKNEAAGYYFDASFTINPEELVKLENALKLEDDVIRHLLILKPEKTEAKKSTKAKEVKETAPEKESHVAKATRGKESEVEEIKVEATIDKVAELKKEPHDAKAEFTRKIGGRDGEAKPVVEEEEPLKVEKPKKEVKETKKTEKERISAIEKEIQKILEE